MELFKRRERRKRKYKVPRGTGAMLSKELRLDESHISRVIRGEREPGPTLYARLVEIEQEHKKK